MNINCQEKYYVSCGDNCFTTLIPKDRLKTFCKKSYYRIFNKYYYQESTFSFNRYGYSYRLIN